MNVSLVVCSSKSPLADSPPICGFVFSVHSDEEGRTPAHVCSYKYIQGCVVYYVYIVIRKVVERRKHFFVFLSFVFMLILS